MLVSPHHTVDMLQGEERQTIFARHISVLEHEIETSKIKESLRSLKWVITSTVT